MLVKETGIAEPVVEPGRSGDFQVAVNGAVVIDKKADARHFENKPVGSSANKPYPTSEGIELVLAAIEAAE